MVTLDGRFGHIETLGREVWAPAFSNIDTEIRGVEGRDRHTPDAEIFSMGGREPTRTLAIN